MGFNPTARLESPGTNACGELAPRYETSSVLCPLMLQVRPSYANVMSTIAVFIALGGTSYAVSSLPKGSVGERQLRKASVTGSKLAKNSVTSAKIADGTIMGDDLSPGLLSGGPRGPRGPEGPAGREGRDGRDGASAGETILGSAAANDTFVTLPGAANSSVVVATLLAPPGAWNLDAQTRLQYGPVPATGVWVNCDLATASGERITRSSAHVGNTAGAAVTQIVPFTATTTFAATTQLTLTCRHEADVPQSIGVVQTTLRATRVVRIEQQ